MNKKGVSEIVSHVLLIVIAIGIATLVYAFLQAYVPKEKPECKEGISLIIENATCTNSAGQNILKLTLENKGLFKVDKAFIRISKEGRQVKADVPNQNPLQLLNKAGAAGINPEESTSTLNFPLPADYDALGSYILEVQPAHFTKEINKDSLALCPSITEKITCA